jgi:hypothetical protein
VWLMALFKNNFLKVNLELVDLNDCGLSFHLFEVRLVLVLLRINKYDFNSEANEF